MTLTVGSLFSGIGGIDLGLQRAGMTIKWHSEIEPFACQVLKKHWADVPNLGDITKINWENVPHVDVIAGGYPCQPFSLAGNRNGENDPRHLWPHFRNAISRIRPRYAFMENVRGHLTLGGLSVIGDLAAIGYDCEWRVISAASVGAHHRRDRIIIVAYPQGIESIEPTEPKRRQGAQRRGGNFRGEEGQTSEMAHPDHGLDRAPRNGFDPRGATQIQERRFAQPEPGRCRALVFGPDNYRRATAEFRGHKYWETQPGVGRLADGVSHRLDRLRGLGNAVVPQVAEIVGRLIVSHADD